MSEPVQFCLCLVSSQFCQAIAICVYFGLVVIFQKFLSYGVLAQLSIHTDFIGVNISERKSGTERTKKRESVFFPPPEGATGTVDDTRICPSYDNAEYLYPGPYAARTKSQLNNQAKHTKVYKQIHDMHDQMVILYYEIGVYTVSDPLMSLVVMICC